MQLQPMGIAPFVILFLLLAVGPVAVGFFVFRQASTINHGAVWVVILVAIATFFLICFAMLNRSVTLENSRLVVKSTFYSTEIKITDIDDIQIVVLGSTEDIVGMRVNGVALPGFKSGWFNSKQGGRIFVDRVAGSFLLISVRGRSQLALEFADPASAVKALSTDVNH